MIDSVRKNKIAKLLEADPDFDSLFEKVCFEVYPFSSVLQLVQVAINGDLIDESMPDKAICAIILQELYIHCLKLELTNIFFDPVRIDMPKEDDIDLQIKMPKYYQLQLSYDSKYSKKRALPVFGLATVLSGKLLTYSILTGLADEYEGSFIILIKNIITESWKSVDWMHADAFRPFSPLIKIDLYLSDPAKYGTAPAIASVISDYVPAANFNKAFLTNQLYKLQDKLREKVKK